MLHQPILSTVGQLLSTLSTGRESYPKDTKDKRKPVCTSYTSTITSTVLVIRPG